MNSDLKIVEDFCQKTYGRFLFSNIAIEASDFCNRDCKFCPVGVERKPVSRLDDQTILAIFEQLAVLNYVGQICFNWYNEPLADKRLTTHIKMARSACPKSFIYFATNGDLLTMKLLDEMVEVGLNWINVSQYDGTIANNVLQCRETIAGREHMSVGVKGKDDLWNSRGGMVQLLPSPLQVRCTRPDEQLVISATGDVPLCCNDYAVTVKVGNVKDKSLVDLWDSLVLAKARKALRAGDRTQFDVCKNCNEPDAGYDKFLISTNGRL